MNITFYASPLDKPVGMTLRAELAWRYFQFNNGGWQAGEMGDESIIVTDESGGCSGGWAFPDVDSFVDWLDLTASDALDNEPESFLEHSGAVLPALLNEEVTRAILKIIDANTAEHNSADKEGAHSV